MSVILFDWFEDLVAVIFVANCVTFVYCLRILWKHSQKTWFVKRGVISLWCFLAISGMVTIIIQPTTTLLIYVDKERKYIFIENIFAFLWVYFAKFAVEILIVRSILVYVNVRRVQESEHVWKSAIDPDYQHHGPNTFQRPPLIVKYYYLFGNPTYLLLFFGIYCMIEIICGLIVVSNGFVYSNPFDQTFINRYVIFLCTCAATGLLPVSVCAYFFIIFEKIYHLTIYLFVKN